MKRCNKMADRGVYMPGEKWEGIGLFDVLFVLLLAGLCKEKLISTKLYGEGWEAETFWCRSRFNVGSRKLSLKL